VKARDLVGIVEAAYAIEREPHDWLANIHDVIAPVIDAGLGTCAYIYDASAGAPRLLDTVLRDAPLDLETVKAIAAGASAAYVDRSWRSRPAAHASEIPGYDDEPVVTSVFAPAGIADMLVINAYDPSGFGVYFGAFCPRRGKLSEPRRATYDRVAAHVAAGFRLRRRVALSEAVLTPRGQIVHAEKSAKLSTAREALATAVRAIDRARGKLRHTDPDAAVGRWRTLVTGRWSLVDHFERDGKRYLIARANEPQTPSLEALTPRERQVLALAAIGHPPKLIAYDLGIASSTVRVLIARAATKLRTRGMAATIRKFLALTRT